jgi:hypothetical protein
MSPIPLNKIFSRFEYVVVANSLSQLKLRVTDDIFIKKHPDDVLYFPCYEAVMYGTKIHWEIDMRYVSSGVVNRIISLFQYIF